MSEDKKVGTGFFVNPREISESEMEVLMDIVERCRKDKEPDSKAGAISIFNAMILIFMNIAKHFGISLGEVLNVAANFYCSVSAEMVFRGVEKEVVDDLHKSCTKRISKIIAMNNKRAAH